MVGKSESQSRFNIMVNQTVVAVGQDAHTELLRRTLSPLNFVQFKVAKTDRDVDANAQFLVAVVDYTVQPSVQALAQFITNITGFSGAIMVYAIAPPVLGEQDLLFGVELGVKRIFFGPKRDEDIRTHIKQHARALTEIGSMAFVELEVMKALQKRSEDALKAQCEKLVILDKMNEDVNRLQALLYEARSDFRRMEYHLKQVLKINPQNLWAANYLGRYYLRNRKVAEGLEILKKLSRFHELSAERMLLMGEAYLNVGRAAEAEQALTKGDRLTGGADPRFTDGLAKVDIMKGDMQSALARVGKRFLSGPILAFLNTRAVLAARAGKMDEAVVFYHDAIKGCDPVDRGIMAKLWFNLGLAYVRANQLPKAVDALSHSVEVGAGVFERAGKTLAVVRQNMAKTKTAKALSAPQDDMFDVEFESFR